MTLSQATRGRLKLVESQLELSCHAFVKFLVDNLFELHLFGVCSLVVGCQAARAEK